MTVLQWAGIAVFVAVPFALIAIARRGRDDNSAMVDDDTTTAQPGFGAMGIGGNSGGTAG